MIRANKLGKSFDGKWALQGLEFELAPGQIWGLVGSNGAGKSTLLRLICGVYRASVGTLTLSDKPIYDNPETKREIFYVADTPFFYRGYSLEEMGQFYRTIYPNWSDEQFKELFETFRLPHNKPLHTFSKGMQRQSALILGLSTRPSWLLLDEAFDGLDPVMRQVVRQLVIRLIEGGESSVMISSHNLREMEDFCDHALVLHESNQILRANLDDLRSDINKVQVVYSEEHPDYEKLGLKIKSRTTQGVLETLIIAAPRDQILETLGAFKPHVLNIIPLTFEELFLEELANVHYDVRALIG